MYTRTVHKTTPRSEVRSVMMWPVATIEGGATLLEVAEALAADEVGALLVTDDGALVGIVSERDVVAHLAAGVDPSHLLASDVMSTDLVVVDPDDSVQEAARRMQEAQVRHLPVIDGSCIAGIVSIRDLLPVFAEETEDSSVVVVKSGTRVMVVEE